MKAQEVKVQVALGETGRLYTFGVRGPASLPADQIVAVGDIVAVPPPWWNPGAPWQEVPVVSIGGSDYLGEIITARLVRHQPRPKARTQAPRMSRAEADRLYIKALELHRQGYTHRQIAEAAGVSKSTITVLLESHGHKGIKNMRPPRDQPAPILYRDGDVATLDPGPLYRRSTTLQLLGEAVGQLRRDNAVNRLAHDVADALAAEDEIWVAKAHRTLAEASAYLARLHAVLGSPAARERAIHDPAERDDLAPLHLVKP